MKDPMKITRLTTDEPENNTETMLNYAYGKDNRAALRYADGQEDVDLCEYISKCAKEKGCNVEPEDLMEGACMECDCELAILYTVAVQAAELRGRLKMYEDAGMDEDTKNKIVGKRNEVEQKNEELFGMWECGEYLDDDMIYQAGSAAGYIAGLNYALEVLEVE